MFGAVKFLLPLGIAIAGVFALTAKSAKALPGGNGTPPLPPGPGKAGAMTLEQVAQRMTAALGTADPKVITALADELASKGFPTQAQDLRGVAADLARVAASAAGVKPPAIPPVAAATPPAQMPVASPAAPEIAVVPPAKPAPSPVPQVSLPEMVITPQTPPVVKNAALENVQRAVIHLNSTKKWQENRNQIEALQMQEKALGHYVSLDPARAGQPAVVDSLYGPGLAFAIAKFYGIVPPNPFYWPKVNPQPSLRLYKEKLEELAQADPARASEWRMAAAQAKVI